MVGGVEPRPAKGDPHGEDHLAQSLLLALRAPGERWIFEVLVAVELEAAVFATVGIDRHAEFIIRRPVSEDKGESCMNPVNKGRRVLTPALGRGYDGGGCKAGRAIAGGAHLHRRCAPTCPEPQVLGAQCQWAV